MRAKKVRAIRKAYIAKYGAAPSRAQWTPVDGGFSVEESKWRGWKKDYLKESK